MKIAFVTPSISRQAGGLFDAVRHQAKALAGQGNEVVVYSVEDSDSNKDLASWGTLNVQLFRDGKVPRFSYSSELKKELLRHDCEVVLSQGLWQYTSIATLAWHGNTQKPYIANPHGMLDRWALRNSKWRKAIAALLFERKHLERAACIRALSRGEVTAIRNYGLRNPICLIPNGVEQPVTRAGDQSAAPWRSRPEIANKKVLFSLGRLHPKKNLAELIRGWRLALQSDPTIEKSWALVIAGWDEVGHEAQLQALVQNLGLGDSIWFSGPLFDHAKAAAYETATAFVLPSLSEGLPMVALEAWAYGLPVLMTPECNLREGFQAGAAISIPTDAAGIGCAIVDFTKLSNQERIEMGVRGTKLTLEKFDWASIGRQMQEVLHWVRREGAQPDCVIT